MVLDSTAFYAGVPYSGTSGFYTTPLILKEISHTRTASTSLHSLIDSSRLTVSSPSHTNTARVKEAAARSGDISGASEADISVLALALDLRDEGYDVSVLSDDFAVENVASLMDLRVSPVLTRGISKTVSWVTYCSGCGKVFKQPDAGVCDVCGTRLKRRFRTGRKG